MRTKIFTITVASLLCLGLTVPPLPAPFSRIARAQTASSPFFTSFEKGDPVPSWTNTAETEKNGKVLSSGIVASVNGKTVKTMRTSVGNGPAGLYASSDNGGWTGTHTLTYSGKVVGKKGSLAINKLYMLNIPVKADTQLSYFIAPVAPKNNPASAASSYVSIDLAFSDGTYLHQISRAADQDGVRMTPSAQGQSGTLIANQWNQKIADIGKVAAGKTITRVLIAYSAPKSGISFQGAVDDIRIGSAPKNTASSSPADEVNILRGTASNSDFSRGNTVPAVAVPNSFAFWSPATDSSSSDRPYPYSENNDLQNLPEIQSFSLSHSPNLQSGDRQSLQVMPSDFSGTPSASRLNRGLAFQRSQETAKPYDYSVTFLNGIKAEIAPASHSAVLRFTFKGKTGNLIFDNLDNQGGLTLSADRKSIEGYSDVKDSTTGNTDRLFFYASFDQPVIDSNQLSGQGRDHVTAFYKFNTSGNKTVTMRTGYSLISVDQAKTNLNLEIGSMSFDQVRQNAKNAWNSLLGKVSVQGADSEQKTTLYSSLYRLFLYPNAGFENTGTNQDPDYRYADLSASLAGKNTANKTGAPIKEGQIYVNSNFAYSAQTVWPAYVLLDPQLAGRLINGFLQYENNGGTISQSSSASFADSAFSDAYVKGVPGVNPDQLYRTLLTEAAAGVSGIQNRPQQSSAPFTGYTNTDQKQSINWTLSDSINDFALGSLASYLSQQSAGGSYADDSAYYLSRAQNYLNLFDRSTGSFNGKTADGQWQKSGNASDPQSWSNDQAVPNILNLDFDVPQDGQGLANLYGGRSGLLNQLDKYFSAVPGSASAEKYSAAREAAAGHSGMFTLDSPSSPSIPYMYTFAGAPWKTQETVRNIMNHFYSGASIGQGYLGDDTGAMLSGFYFFSAAGFYPLEKGTPDYVLGAPYFKQMTIHLDNGHDLVISAPNVSNTNRYVQSVTFNGRPLSATSISHQLLAGGGTLSFRMGPKPSNWGSSESELPKSLTPLSTDGSSIYPMPLTDLTGKSASDSRAETTSSDNSSLDPLLDNQSDTAVVFSGSQPSVMTRFKEEDPKVKMYTLTSSASSLATSDPKSWIMFGSDDGSNWTMLDSRTNETFGSRSMTRSFSIKNAKAYRFYKLEITEKSSQLPLAISEYQLLGYSDIGSSFDTMRRQLISEFEAKNLSEPDTAALSYTLNQAQTAYRQDKISTAVYCLQDYVRQLNALGGARAQDARHTLSADAHAVINLLSD